MLLIFPAILLASPAEASDASEIPFNAARILEFHNAERAARGIAPLARDSRMDQHAQQLAESLAARGKLEHSPSVAITLGYSSGGQNLVFRAPSLNASQANHMWMTSDGHRKNLLQPGFTHAGIGLACSTASGRAYPVAVVDFGGTGINPGMPSQDPITVPHDALQGHGINCSGTGHSPGAPPAAAPPAPAPAPPALTAPEPVPAAAPTLAPAAGTVPIPGPASQPTAEPSPSPTAPEPSPDPENELLELTTASDPSPEPRPGERTDTISATAAPTSEPDNSTKSRVVALAGALVGMSLVGLVSVLLYRLKER